MGNEINPVIDQWYQYVGGGELMRVVAIDQAEGLIEVQRFDGNIEELDEEAWGELDIQLAEPPEDWTGPYDDADLDEQDESMQSELISDWRLPVDNTESAEERWDEIPTLDENQALGDGAAIIPKG